ncbi:uncharacterized protein [Haliotis cracherodii]|uniref:uncharacterized protein n=1 Tax=Haliotis cracherodii TaxID=6455 RepID=UPI0039E9E304
MDVKESKREIFSPRPVFDYSETLRFWKRREGRLVPDFVLRAFMAAGDEIRVREELHGQNGRSISGGSPKYALTLLWWSVTILFLSGLLCLMMSDRFVPNLFAEDCNCHSVFEVLGWDIMGSLPDML